ncbi:MAG: biopolymer transporter ExbD [Cyclobacteriaceae bacterium]|jgi:biopolymer transport protein ExbD
MPRSTPEIPNASMADIAFLLLTFFLVTTTISNDRGLSIQLPPPPEAQQQDVKIQEHNMFKIQVNSSDALLVEGNPMSDVTGLKDQIKKFILNRGADPTMSDSPEKAIISFKTDRGTTHRKFIEILDIIQGAYYDIYAEQAGVSNKEFREAASDPGDPAKKAIYDRGRQGIPMSVSIAEPTKVGN